MNGKSLNRYLLFVFLFCGCFHSCLQDEMFSEYAKEKRFFKTDGADECLRLIAGRLRQKNDSASFIGEFVEKYGYPLWRDAYKFSENDNMVFAVPVRSKVPDAEIDAIWFFSVFSGHTEYRIYTREMVRRFLSETGGDGIEETWMFDYFTSNVLHRKPKSNLILKKEKPVATYSTIIVETKRCVHAYAGYEGAEGDLGMHCWTTTTVYYLSDNSDISGGGNGSIVGGIGGGGSGGENGGGSTSGSVNPAQMAPKAAGIFRNSHMTEQNWKILENMIDKIMSDCLGEELYNGLKSYLDGKTLTIQFKEGSNGSFGMQGESVGIALGMQMESNQLLHEMFHAYQAYQNTLAQYNNSLLNNEIEAHYAQYLYISRLPEYAGSKWEKRDIRDVRRKSIKKLSEYIDKKGNLHPGITDDLLDIEITSRVIPAFRDAGYTVSKYPLNENQNGIANFKTLNKLTINCK